MSTTHLAAIIIQHLCPFPICHLGLGLRLGHSLSLHPPTPTADGAGVRLRRHTPYRRWPKRVSRRDKRRGYRHRTRRPRFLERRKHARLVHPCVGRFEKWQGGNPPFSTRACPLRPRVPTCVQKTSRWRVRWGLCGGVGMGPGGLPAWRVGSEMAIAMPMMIVIVNEMKRARIQRRRKRRARQQRHGRRPTSLGQHRRWADEKEACDYRTGKGEKKWIAYHARRIRIRRLCGRHVRTCRWIGCKGALDDRCSCRGRYTCPSKSAIPTLPEYLGSGLKVPVSICVDQSLPCASSKVRTRRGVRKMHPFPVRRVS